MAEPKPSDEAMDQLESQIKNLGAAIATFRASSSLRMDAIKQMLNQLQHQQIANHRKQSHGSNSNPLFPNYVQTPIAITELEFSNPDHYSEEEAHIINPKMKIQTLQSNQHSTLFTEEFQQNHQQFQNPKSSRVSTEFPNLTSKTLDLQPRLLNQKSEQIGEAETFLFQQINGSTQMAMAEVDDDQSAQGGVEDDAVSEEGGDSCNARKASTTLIRYPQGGDRGLHRSSSIAAKPPPLMAAVFPWNRERESQTQGKAKPTDVPLLTGGGVEVAMKLFVHEQAPPKAGETVVSGEAQADVESNITPTVPHGFSVLCAREKKRNERKSILEKGALIVVDGGAPEEVEGGNTEVVPPCFAGVKQTAEERKPWKLLGFALLGFKWALVTHGLRLIALGPNQAKLGHKFWINGYIFVWDPGGRFYFTQ